MASHKGWDRDFVATSVLSEGRSLNLARAKGQFGIVDMDSVPTKDGLKVISSFNGLSKDNQFQLRLGKAPISVNRSQSNKPYASRTFSLAEVVDLKVDAPKVSDFKVDDFIVGYNGFDADTALTFENGDNQDLDIELSGRGIGVLGYEDSKVTVKLQFEAPNTGDFTNHEIVQNAVERLREKTLLGGVPITEYIDAFVVNSGNDAVISGNESAFFTLTVEDAGDYSALAKIQSQFNAYKVVRTGRTDSDSVYTVIAAPQEVVTAGSFVTGQEYTITTAGTTDFTAVGAADSVVGTRFVATGAGTGTGTATEVRISDYSKFKTSLIKGCDDCPAGYTEFEDGFVYNVTLEDDGADSTATAEGLGANVVAGSAVKVGQVDGAGSYTVVSNSEVTEAEIAAFIEANPTATVDLVSTDVSELCSPTNLDTTAWVQGDTCSTLEDTYTITLADDECGDDKLAALQAAYPDLTIAVASQSACQTRYTTDVITNLVCEECDPMFRDLFVSEAPEPFDLVEWKKEEQTFSDTALMGIRIRGKKSILSGSEAYRDDMFWMASSTRIKVAGNVEQTISESFSSGGERMAVKILSIADEPVNWGGDLRPFEDISKRYWEGVSRHEGNNYGKWVLGEESDFDGTTPYVDYILTVRKNSYAQSFSGEKNETFYYHIWAKPGKHQEVEAVLNSLAAAAGVKPVQAYGKTEV